MPKNYSEIYTSVYTTGNSMSFGNTMLRGNGIPLDITEVYDSFDTQNTKTSDVISTSSHSYPSDN